ncbi:MAG TPA: UdgX family uracil-DNA binding protein [Methylomirabilota bacterium]|nr:UdgX family uracil-DNA binding protein [Methylomirabilota bacterium]
MAKAEAESAAAFLPEIRTLEALRDAARSCRGCDLYRDATQTVFGEGAERARVILVGEQPGDMEDRQGHPFVGPAGRILDKALAEAQIPRDEVYVTNAVKHFKYIWRGKRRLHQKPTVRQVSACRPWLQSELQALQPKVLVCLGATAALAIVGKSVPITQLRGQFLQSIESLPALITIHPSSILRQPESDDREREYRRFLADIKLVRQML